jgi:shikimate dehydrogenase
MIQLGLIGKSLQHSFSKSYFEEKFKSLGLTNYHYTNFELAEIEAVKVHFAQKDVLGLNVTIPYKEAIIPFIDQLDTDALAIGAVNCIKFIGGKTIGYNTDVYGFAQSIKPFLDVTHERALILGTGGASKAVAHALKKVGVDVFYVTHSNEKKYSNSFFYSELNDRIFSAFKLIINTSPLGTFPNVDQYPPLPFHLINDSHFVYDLIYNPTETRLLQLAKLQGALTMNGLSMLKLQAEKSWEIWHSTN